MCPVKKKMKINDTVFTFGDLEDLPAVWSLPKNKIVLKPEANLHKYEVLWTQNLKVFEAAVEHKYAFVQIPWYPFMKTEYCSVERKSEK